MLLVGIGLVHRNRHRLDLGDEVLDPLRVGLDVAGAQLGKLKSGRTVKSLELNILKYSYKPILAVGNKM